MAAGCVFDSDGSELADEVVVVGDDDCSFFKSCSEVVVEFGAEVEEVFGVGGFVADVNAYGVSRARRRMTRLRSPPLVAPGVIGRLGRASQSR